MLSQFQAEIQQAAFWLATGKIIWIDMLLSGDNALVIAMACRALAPRQRMMGMLLGAGAAVLLRILCTGTISTLMELPYLKVAGGVALLFIAAKLLVPEPEGDDAHKAPERLLAAVGTIVVADITMSIDNVIAVAAAANGSLALLILGLAISIPLIVAGAAVVSTILNKFPVLVWAGAALLGWIAGEVIATDPAIAIRLSAPFDWPPFFGGLGICAVLLVGAIWRSRRITLMEVGA